MKKIWITWEKHRRTIELASALPGVKLFQLEIDAPRIIRYPCLLFRSALVLLSEWPGLVIVQNPSIILSLFIVIMGKTGRFNAVIDAHNEGLTPFDSKHSWLHPIYSIIQKWAALTIVTNVGLAKKVEENGGKPFILEDKLPCFKTCKHICLKGRYNVVFVCTFEKDEPYAELIKAATLVDPSIHIYITGAYQKSPQDTLNLPFPNISFTGFLPDQDYINLLYSCDAVIDLTLMEDCLVCGAYEAVALGKPVILSDTQALRNYFSKGAVYTKNAPQDIADAITYALQNKENLTREISPLKAELEEDWKKKFSNLVDVLDELAGQN